MYLLYASKEVLILRINFVIVIVIALVSSNLLNRACMNNYAKLNSDVIESGVHHQ